MVKILVCIYKEEDKAILESLLPEDVSIEWDPEFIYKFYDFNKFNHKADNYCFYSIGILNKIDENKFTLNSKNIFEEEIKNYFLKNIPKNSIYNKVHCNNKSIESQYPSFFTLLDNISNSKINLMQFIFQNCEHYAFNNDIKIFQEGATEYLKRLLFNFSVWRETKINLYEKGSVYFESSILPFYFRIINNE